MSTKDPRELVARTNRMLYTTGMIDYSGHVSNRHADGDKAYVNSHRESRGEIRPEDVVTVTMDGNPVTEDGPRPVGETAIHTAIYRARDDVSAVLHLHPPYMTMFGISGVDLEPVHIRGAVLVDGAVPVFDCPNHVSTRELGEEMVETMGDRNEVILRGHGAVVCDESMERAFARAVYLEMNAYYQHQASILGDPTVFTPEETKGVYDYNWRDRVVEKFWHFYEWKAIEEGHLPAEW